MSTEDTSFKDREELLDWIKDKKPVVYVPSNNVYYYEECQSSAEPFGYNLNFTRPLCKYQKHIEPEPKKKVTLYRYLYRIDWNYKSTDWSTFAWENFEYPGTSLIKTETREVEVEVEYEENFYIRASVTK